MLQEIIDGLVVGFKLVVGGVVAFKVEVEVGLEDEGRIELKSSFFPLITIAPAAIVTIATAAKRMAIWAKPLCSLIYI